jgi:phospholipase A1
MKYNNLLLLFALSLFFSQKTKAQSNTAIDSIQFKNVVEEMPSFTIFGDNYIISGTTLGQTPNSNNSDAKMQIGFKQRVTNATLPWNTFLFFTWTGSY